MKQMVAIGLLGPVLDQGWGSRRWERWRPTVSLCQQEDLLINRFVLLCQKRYSRLATQVTDDIRQVSPETEVDCRGIEFDDPWDFEEVYGALHDFARTYPFDPEKDDYLVHITTGTHVAQICLFLLTESRHLPARLIQTRPSHKVKNKIAGEYSIIDLDLSKYDRIAMRFNEERGDDISFLKSGINTCNSRFNRLIEQIERVAANTPDPILLTGPTGAGKSRLARRIFELKKARHRLGGDFIEVNCATLRGDGAMSALFGHKRGAFTGALRDRNGLLRSADGGILFLDEVGELGPDEQAMLLRAIEEKTFLPVGADRETASDFQLLCGTNRDLRENVRKGLFREDLFARINLWTFELPGLRERPEDIEPNLDYELERFSERSGMRVTFNSEARRRFLGFAVSGDAAWTANFRDLGGAVTRMATLAPGGRITRDVVEDEIDRLLRAWSGNVRLEDYGVLLSVLGEEGVGKLDMFDKMQLDCVLRVCRVSRTLSDAGRTLYHVSRGEKKTVNDADRLRKYLGRFGIRWEDIRDKLQERAG
jgi:transcriptional regulatory protein RtcR